MLICNRGPPHRPEYYVELQQQDSPGISELAVKLHITTYFPYLKCAAEHFEYLGFEVDDALEMAEQTEV